MPPEILLKIQDFFKQESPTKTYAKGQLIILAGQDPRGVAYLESGAVEQYDITPEGTRIAVNIFKPPAFFPMSWAINHGPNTYFYEILADAKIRWANPDRTVDFLHQNPDILFNLMSRVYAGTDGLLRRLVLAVSGAARSRLIYELLIEAYRFGVTVDDGSRRVRVRQHSLAARTGLTRETVSREIHKLEAAGLITRSSQGIEFKPEDLETILAQTS